MQGPGSVVRYFSLGEFTRSELSQVDCRSIGSEGLCYQIVQIMVNVYFCLTAEGFSFVLLLMWRK